MINSLSEQYLGSSLLSLALSTITVFQFTWETVLLIYTSNILFHIISKYIFRVKFILNNIENIKFWKISGYCLIVTVLYNLINRFIEHNFGIYIDFSMRIFLLLSYFSVVTYYLRLNLSKASGGKRKVLSVFIFIIIFLGLIIFQFEFLAIRSSLDATTEYYFNRISK